MDITQMIAMAEMQDLERDMRARRQRHELMESRRGHAANGLRERIRRFEAAAFPGRRATDSRSVTCAAC